jgi:hypothetical protein
VVLAVAQVNRLRFASQANLDELAVHLLSDPTAKIDCQLLCLVPASIEDDPTQIMTGAGPGAWKQLARMFRANMSTC